MSLELTYELTALCQHHHAAPFDIFNALSTFIRYFTTCETCQLANAVLAATRLTYSAIPHPQLPPYV
jgi:hypothetical protein